MIVTRSQSQPTVVFEAMRLFFHHKMNELQQARARRKIYRATFQELSALSDQELKDLCIPRSAIRHLAHEAAYGV